MAKAHGKGRGGRGRQPKEYQEVVIQIDRVTRVVKGGRRMRFRATVAIGNKKGKVGIGLGKSVEVAEAIKKAVTQAKKNLIIVPLDQNTIPHDIQIKFKASKIRLIPAGPGTGVIAGGSVRKVLELAGVKNILSKSLGSSNRVNNAKATIQALQALQSNHRMNKAKSVAPAVKAAQKATAATKATPKVKAKAIKKEKEAASAKKPVAKKTTPKTKKAKPAAKKESKE